MFHPNNVRMYSALDSKEIHHWLEPTIGNKYQISTSTSSYCVHSGNKTKD